nr:GntR family transcriptional regulator [Granulicella aggregans]
MPFSIALKPGLPIADQIVYAAKKAIVAGVMRAGDPFPSVRALSKALLINPNTAHKVVSELTMAGLLSIQPGIGTVITAPSGSSSRERTALLGPRIEELIVEARRLGITQEEVLQSIAVHYQSLTPKNRDKPIR